MARPHISDHIATASEHACPPQKLCSLASHASFAQCCTAAGLCNPPIASHLLQADIDAYTTEMEVIGAAYEDMQAKNSRLLQQLAEKDGVNSQVMTEKIQAQHQAAARAEQQQQAEAAKKLAGQQMAAMQERVAALEAKLQVLINQLTRHSFFSLTTSCLV